jgi:hypothetical protein
MTMTTQINNSPEDLEAMRLPELQARFEEVVGEPNRCPNRTFLIRKITEALAGGAGTVTPPQPPTVAETGDSPTDGPSEATEPDDAATVAEWQARYQQVVGRATGSSNVRYLRWKVRQAERGLVPVGPTTGHRTGPPVEHKVLPLRLAAAAVDGLDEARKRQGLKTRMELFRRALHLYLTSVGEPEAAEPFAPRS